jgi:hypothetical protein
MRASVYLMTVGSVTFLSNFNNADASTLPESAGRTGRERSPRQCIEAIKTLTYR